VGGESTTSPPATEGVGLDGNPSNRSRNTVTSFTAPAGGSVIVLEGASWVTGVGTEVWSKNTDLSRLLESTVMVEVVPRVDDTTHGTTGVVTDGEDAAPGVDMTGVVNTLGLDDTRAWKMGSTTDATTSESEGGETSMKPESPTNSGSKLRLRPPWPDEQRKLHSAPRRRPPTRPSDFCDQPRSSGH